jgi:hypothetical protein
VVSQAVTRDVSVVMGTYNGERYIAEQLASILAQTLLPAEIIVSDDGSTDATLQIVESIAKDAPAQIRVHGNPRRLGFADNFLNACTHATSPVIAFSDQDDRWAPTKLEAAERALRDTAAVLCVHRVRLIDSAGTVLGDNRPRRARTRVLDPLQADPWGNFYGFTMIFRRHLLELIPSDSRGLDPHAHDAELSHDRWIYFLAQTFGRIVVLDECLADYRQHDGQLYGGEGGRSLQERIATKLSTGRAQSQYLAEVAAHRAALLEAPIPGAEDALRRAAAAQWATRAGHLRRRAGLYDEISTGERLARLTGNVRDGTYRAFRHGGLGVRRLAEDLSVSACAAGIRSRPAADRQSTESG